MKIKEMIPGWYLQKLISCHLFGFLLLGYLISTPGFCQLALAKSKKAHSAVEISDKPVTKPDQAPGSLKRQNIPLPTPGESKTVETKNPRSSASGFFRSITGGGHKLEKTTNKQLILPALSIGEPIPESRVVESAVTGQENNSGAQLAVDAALVSVLKDISKELRESKEVAKIIDPAQKYVLRLAYQALTKALTKSDLQANRIISKEEKKRLVKEYMTAQAWESGNVKLLPHCHVSIVALWAKKLDGFINILVAGNCGSVAFPKELNPKELTNVGEFVVIINAKSIIENGLDVQSQTDVDFWLGKLSSINIAVSPAVADKTSRLIPVLTAPLTKNAYKYLEVLTASRKKETELGNMLQPEQLKGTDQSKPMKASVTPVSAGQVGSKQVASNQGSFNSTKANETGVSSAIPTAAKVTAIPAITSTVSQTAKQLLFPEKAVAGQFLTTSVLNANYVGEPNVELSFNGTTLLTSQDGKANYLVPEDAAPGPSLLVSLLAHPELPPHVIQVLQPLMIPAEIQVPRIDHISSSAAPGSTLTINGHSFDGIAERNRIIIDGVYDARVLIASPVQLKAILPSTLVPGKHSACVSTAGLRSNPGQFEVIAVHFEPLVKKAGTKEQLYRLKVKVVGTENKVRLKLKNDSPAVIRLDKGNSQTVITPGGPHNFVVLNAERISNDNFHINAQVELLQEARQETSARKAY